MAYHHARYETEMLNPNGPSWRERLAHAFGLSDAERRGRTMDRVEARMKSLVAADQTEAERLQARYGELQEAVMEAARQLQDFETNELGLDREPASSDSDSA